jgi:hypothetical protein
LFPQHEHWFAYKGVIPARRDETDLVSRSCRPVIGGLIGDDIGCEGRGVMQF